MEQIFKLYYKLSGKGIAIFIVIAFLSIFATKSYNTDIENIGVILAYIVVFSITIFKSVSMLTVMSRTFQNYIFTLIPKRSSIVKSYYNITLSTLGILLITLYLPFALIEGVELVSFKLSLAATLTLYIPFVTGKLYFNGMDSRNAIFVAISFIGLTPVIAGILDNFYTVAQYENFKNSDIILNSLIVMLIVAVVSFFWQQLASTVSSKSPFDIKGISLKIANTLIYSFQFLGYKLALLMFVRKTEVYVYNAVIENKDKVDPEKFTRAMERYEYFSNYFNSEISIIVVILIIIIISIILSRKQFFKTANLYPIFALTTPLLFIPILIIDGSSSSFLLMSPGLVFIGGSFLIEFLDDRKGLNQN